MTEQKTSSPSAEGWVFPHAALVMGAAGIGFGFYDLSGGDWTGFFFFGGLGLFLLAVELRTWGKFGTVAVDIDGVRVQQNGATYRFSWREVESFRTVPLVTPVIYRMTFEGNNLVTYFVPQGSFNITFILWAFDGSGLGAFIRKRLREVQGVV